MVPEGDKAAMLIRNEQPQRLVGAALVGGKYLTGSQKIHLVDGLLDDGTVVARSTCNCFLFDTQGASVQHL